MHVDKSDKLFIFSLLALLSPSLRTYLLNTFFVSSANYKARVFGHISQQMQLLPLCVLQTSFTETEYWVVRCIANA